MAIKLHIRLYSRNCVSVCGSCKRSSIYRSRKYVPYTDLLAYWTDRRVVLRQKIWTEQLLRIK